MLQIVPALSQEQLQHMKVLIQEYVAWDRQRMVNLGFDTRELMAFYYNDGLVELPGEYTLPTGRLLMALFGTQAAGCCALRKQAPGICEINRVYVRSAFRGKKVGRALLEALLQEARDMGYHTARLESADFMKEAQALYRSLGFRYVEPYYDIPEVLKPMTAFMELKLTPV